MINLILLKQNIKSLYKPLIALLLILAMYFSVVIYMYNPELKETLNTFAETMPQMMAFFGMADIATDLTSFMSVYLYGFLMIIVPFFFIVIASQRLVVRHVDDGSMACLLAAPVKRHTVVATQAFSLILCVIIMIAFSTLFGIACAEIFFPGELDIESFVTVNIGLAALQFAVSGLCFLGSCIFNESKNALIVAAAIPLIEYLLQMLTQMGEKLDILKYFTFYALFDTDVLVTRTHPYTLNIIILSIAGIVLYFTSCKIFCKRDLPL